MYSTIFKNLNIFKSTQVSSLVSVTNYYLISVGSFLFHATDVLQADINIC